MKAKNLRKWMDATNTTQLELSKKLSLKSKANIWYMLEHGVGSSHLSKLSEITSMSYEQLMDKVEVEIVVKFEIREVLVDIKEIRQ